MVCLRVRLFHGEASGTGELVPDQGGGGGGDPTINAWIKASSGDWQEQSSWSSGALPNQSQSVYITNSGWKAVAIGVATAQNFPDSLNVGSLTVSSPQDSYNVLFMDHPGYDVPLRAGSVTINTNAVLTVLVIALDHQ